MAATISKNRSFTQERSQLQLMVTPDYTNSSRLLLFGLTTHTSTFNAIAAGVFRTRIEF
ncbi:hypothetical protein [Nostoc sp.]|uniref:hypothetical protein n=1 Tax=Nostoc sp. TaxID=1180 RepID=UPI002FF74BCD